MLFRINYVMVTFFTYKFILFGAYCVDCAEMLYLNIHT